MAIKQSREWLGLLTDIIVESVVVAVVVTIIVLSFYGFLFGGAQ